MENLTAWIILILMSPGTQITVLIFISYCLSRRIVAAKSNGVEIMYGTIYLLLAFVWKTMQNSLEMGFDVYYLLMKNGNFLPSWVVSVEVLMWTAVFGILLWIEVIIQKYYMKRESKIRVYVKSSILILIGLLLIGGMAYIENLKV